MKSIGQANNGSPHIAVEKNRNYAYFIATLYRKKPASETPLITTLKFFGFTLRAPLKTGFVMRMSEKGDSKAEGKIFHNRSHSFCEERFSLTTMLFHFIAVRNRKWFLEVP